MVEVVEVKVVCQGKGMFFFFFFPLPRAFFFLFFLQESERTGKVPLMAVSLYIYIKKSKGAIAEFCEQELGVYIIFVGWYSFFVL